MTYIVSKIDLRLACYKMESVALMFTILVSNYVFFNGESNDMLLDQFQQFLKKFNFLRIKPPFSKKFRNSKIIGPAKLNFFLKYSQY